MAQLIWMRTAFSEKVLADYSLYHFSEQSSPWPPSEKHHYAAPRLTRRNTAVQAFGSTPPSAERG